MDEVPTSRDEYGSKSVLSRPYGLPKSVKMCDYMGESVCFLSPHNYKVEARIGVNSSAQHELLTVLDTGAGPNLIRAAVLPQRLLQSLDSRGVVRLASASKHRLDVLGVTQLVVTVGSLVTRQPFVVVRNLGTDALLGCTFADKHIESIRCRKRVVELYNGDVISIVRRSAAPPDSPTTERCPHVPPVVHTRQFLRVAEAVSLPPLSETVVAVQADVEGPHLLESLDKIYHRKQVTMSNGIANLQRNVPVAVKIANMSRATVTLAKNERVGCAVPAPVNILAIDFEGEPPGKSRDEGGEGLDPVGSFPDGITPSTSDTFTVDDVELSHLNAEQGHRVREMLRPFADMWSGKLGNLSVTQSQQRITIRQQRIELKTGSTPVHAQPYRAGPKARQVEEEHVSKMLDAEVIEPANSEWASPVVLVPKPDGSLRFCVDYRKLNSLTVKDTYPLPRMDECIDSMGEAQFFTTLDANSGYWQIPVAKEDRDKTTFTCHAGCYRFKRMPFGLCNAPATFQRTLDILLAGLRWKTCLVYLDDVIVFSKTLDEHVKHVQDVLNILQRAGISLKLKKCNFFTKAVDYLGHVIKPGRLEVATKNTAAVEGFREPETQTQLRSFLGLCNVYRRFVSNFARVSAPLNKLLKKEQSPKLEPFTDDEWKAFHKLKEALASPPVLRLPRENLLFSVDTDACEYQIGCALMQLHEDGKRYPIGFWSRSLTPAEKNYSVGEKECLVVVWAIQLLRPYLERSHFDLYTDHQALKWMMDMTDASFRLARWRLRLMEFDFTVKYRKGAANTVADCVSRLPTFHETSWTPDLDISCYLVAQEPGLLLKMEAAHVGEDQPRTDERESELRVDLDLEDFEESSKVLSAEPEADLSPITIEELLRAQLVDPTCINIRSQLEEGVSLPYRTNSKGLLTSLSPWDDREQIFVPPPLRAKALALAHYPAVAGHPGSTRMYQTLRREFCWPNMALDTHECVRNCTRCAKERISLRSHSQFLKLFPAARPLEFVALDILGPLTKTAQGNRFL